jgi:mannitol operon repressor
LAFLPVLNKESERGAVLTACSFIDELLRRTLLAYLIEGKVSKTLIDGFNAPLGTFAAGTAAALVLGLISEQEFEECNTLRKIRLQFLLATPD